MIGEWSASFDTLPVKKLDDVMKGIQEKYEAPEFDRIISKERQAFLRNYVEAQMVSWESQNVGVSLAWFYWTMKMEGGAFAEWDFLRGVREGWIPTIPHPNNTSESVYGSCHDIADKTKDDDSIVHEFPNPLHLDDTIWMGLDITDDFVVSHAGSLNKEGTTTTTKSALDDDNKKMSVDEDDLSDDDDDKGTNRMPEDKTEPDVDAEPQQKSWFPLFALAFFCYAIWHVFFKHGGGPNFRPQRYQYTNLDAPTQLSV